MSPAEIALAVALVIAVIVAVVSGFASAKWAADVRRAEDERDEALDREEEAAARSRTAQSELTNDVHRLRSERDEALRQKAAQFEEAQKRYWSLCDGMNRRAAERDAAVARAERAEKVAAAAAKLFNGKDDSGEFRELKEAVREWEGGAS